MEKTSKNQASRKPFIPVESDLDQLLKAFEPRYPEMQYTFVQFVSEHLADCCRTFKGDLGLPLILAIIGQEYLTGLFAGRAAEKPIRAISALRIADVTGLPRETVRRKLGILADKGWIERKRAGWALVTFDDAGSPARRDLAGLDQRGLERLARLCIAVERVLRAPPAFPAKPMTAD